MFTLNITTSSLQNTADAKPPVICWKSLREQQREVLLRSKLLAVWGEWQREGEVRNLVAHRPADLSPMLGRLAGSAESRDFR